MSPAFRTLVVGLSLAACAPDAPRAPPPRAAVDPFVAEAAWLPLLTDRDLSGSADAHAVRTTPLPASPAEPSPLVADRVPDAPLGSAAAPAYEALPPLPACYGPVSRSARHAAGPLAVPLQPAARVIAATRVAGAGCTRTAIRFAAALPYDAILAGTRAAVPHASAIRTPTTLALDTGRTRAAMVARPRPGGGGDALLVIVE